MLTCSCGENDYAWFYYKPHEIEPLTTARSRRCSSCRERISVGEDCMAFPRFCNPAPDSIDERIYGEEKPLATWYLCDRCAGLYESLDSLGFCDLLGQDLREVCGEYAQMQREAGVFRGELSTRPQATTSRTDVSGIQG